MLKDKLTRWLVSNGGDSPLYLVGGSVRDFFLDRAIKDIDLACPNAKDLAEFLSRKHNAALVPMEKDSYAPCYRLVNRKDPADFLDITQYRGPDILTDLGDRDFSINAMALSVADGFPANPAEALLDPFGGKHDLDQGIIRSLGAKNLEDDPLRILRAFRFSAQLGFTIDETTLQDCAVHAPGLKNISAERITSELLQTLETPHSTDLFRLMSQRGILAIIFPEISSMAACQQDGFHHTNVWEHCLETLEVMESILGDLHTAFGDYETKVRECLAVDRRPAWLKLAALFHDIGKPITGRFDEAKGRTTFFGHAKKGERLCRPIVERLRLPLKAQDFICLMVSEHRHIEQLARPEVKKKTRMAWFRQLKDLSVACAVLAMADNKSKHGELGSEEERLLREGYLKDLIHEYYDEAVEILARPLLINGNDLLELGIPKGPEVGRVLKAVTSAQDTGKVKTKDQALKLAKNVYNSKQ